MKLFLSYLKRHLRAAVCAVICTALLLTVLLLYHVPQEAVLYAFLLCAAAGGALALPGFLHWRRQIKQLTQLVQNGVTDIAELPQAQGQMEDVYQELVSRLLQEKANCEAAARRERQDALDYTTLWAHQIKTPIAAMRLLLQSGAQPEELENELFGIERYVEMALTYSRLSEDASDLVLRVCPLDEIVRAAIRRYAKLFILKKLPLDFQESKLEVLTDEKWLQFLVEQLLSNALKYTSQGIIRVYTSGRTLVVEDTGIGIKAEDLPRVFEKGYTGFNGREDKKSTGLGLYLCARVCRLLGHRIRMESIEGEGTKLLVEFPEGVRATE